MLKIVIATALGTLLWLGIILLLDGPDSSWIGLALPLGYLTGLAVRLTIAARQKSRTPLAKGAARGAARGTAKTTGKGRPTPKNPRR